MRGVRLPAPLRSAWIVLALALAGLHMAVFDRGLGGDGWAPFAALESLADDGDLDLENNNHGVLNGLVPTATGHLAMQYPPGVLLLDALPFAAGRVLDRLLPASILDQGVDLPPAGRVPRGVFFSTACIILARNLAVLVGLTALASALLRLGVSVRRTAAALALTFFGGPLVFYSLIGMTHAPVFALAALLLLALVRYREAPAGALAHQAGLLVGAATLVRLGSVALLLPAGAALLIQGAAPTGGPARRRHLLTLGAGFALPLPLLPLWSRINLGTLGAPYGGEWRLTLASPWNILFSPHHGLFLFHPALALAALGLLALAAREIRARRPGWGTVGALWFLAVATLYGWWSEWANVGGFGQRFLIDALPALALGFAAFLEVGRLRALRTVLGVAATLFGLVLFFASVGGLVPPPAGLPWPQRLSDYAGLVRSPPGAGEIGAALRRSSFLLRALGARDSPGSQGAVIPSPNP